MIKTTDKLNPIRKSQNESKWIKPSENGNKSNKYIENLDHKEERNNENKETKFLILKIFV